MQRGNAFFANFPLYLSLLLAFALRLYRFNAQSAWGDEIFTLHLSRMNFGEMTDLLLKDAVHPPLHYYLLHCWYAVAGFGDGQARLVSIFAGVLCVWATWELARNLFGVKTGNVACLLMTVSQLGVEYSQEARPYQLALLFATCSMIFFYRWILQPATRTWWLFALFAVLSIYTHYYCLFVLAGLACFLILTGDWRKLSIRLILQSGAAALLAFAPWPIAVLSTAEAVAKITPASVPTYFASDLLTPVRVLNRFNNGGFDGLLSSAPPWSFVVGALLFTIPLIIGVVNWRVSEQGDAGVSRATKFAFVMWLIPFGGPILVGFLGGNYDTRYSLMGVPSYYVLVAWGLLHLTKWKAGILPVAACVLYSATALRANYTIPYKEDFRGAIRFIASGYRTSDCVAFSENSGSAIPRPLSVYQPDGLAIRYVGGPLDQTATAPCKRVWLLVYERTRSGVHAGRLARQALETSFHLVQFKSFFWTRVQLFGSERP